VSNVLTRLVLELERHKPRIGGRVRADGGEERRFSGWLGLISALDAELAPPSPDGEAARAKDDGPKESRGQGS
jgi:hypothetical protein